MGKESSNKRITKNAIMLTLRSILVAIIGLYTSRVVLETLGVEDFGVYGVVGGIVGMMSFLNGSMAGATSRFLTFELGKNDPVQLRLVFSTCFRIHLILALFVIIVAETVGLWYLNNKMVIPEKSLFAANILYQFTVLSVLVGFTQVPYNADIIAHERMNIYAYFEIIFVVLKLLIVFLLLIIEENRLILYGSLTFAVSLINALFYRFYCLKHFPESKLTKKYDKVAVKNMLSFSGYDLYGNMCVAAKNQGQPLVLNLFYGVVANASASIALTVTGTVQGLTTTITQAFRPQIIKQYALGNIKEMENLMKRAVVFFLMFFSIIMIPLLFETPSILYLWLGQIPEYSVIFLRIILIIALINSMNQVGNAAVHATGNIKIISFIGGSFFLLSVIVSYIFLRHGASAPWIYIIDFIAFIFINSATLFSIYKQIKDFNIKSYIWLMFKCLFCIILTISIIYSLKLTQILPEFPWEQTGVFDILFNLIKTTFFSSITLFVLFYLICLNGDDRKFIVSKITGIFLKFKKQVA